MIPVGFSTGVGFQEKEKISKKQLTVVLCTYRTAGGKPAAARTCESAWANNNVIEPTLFSDFFLVVLVL